MSYCGKCNDTGLKPVYMDGFAQLELCSCGCDSPIRFHRRLDAVARSQQARIPARHHRASSWGFWKGVDEAVVGRARNVCGKGDSLWLASVPGTGKTCLSVLLAVDGLRRGQSVMWVDAPELLEQAKAEFDRSMNGDGIVALATRVEVLVLDDVDKLRTGNDGLHSEWVDSQMWRLFKHRCEHDLQTIVTSNCPAVDWCARSRHRQALRSRVEQHFWLATLRGGDQRQKRGEL